MNNTYNNNHSKLQNNLSCNKILQNILELDEIERKNVYKELIKYCGSNDRKFIKEEIKTYTHKGIIIYKFLNTFNLYIRFIIIKCIIIILLIML